MTSHPRIPNDTAPGDVAGIRRRRARHLATGAILGLGLLAARPAGAGPIRRDAAVPSAPRPTAPPAVLPAAHLPAPGLPGRALPAPDTTDRTARIRELLEAYHAQRRFNGVALVAEGEEVLFEGAFGEADMEWGVPLATDARFRVGSITKQVTAALILRLVEEGRLALDAPVTEYIPEYPRPQGERVTIHHLLTHTSGIPSYTNLPEFLDEVRRDSLSPAEIVELTWEEPLEFEPGTRYAYDNTGYVLLGWIAERVTGRPYAEALRDEVLAPLGLDATAYDPGPEIVPHQAFGYDRTLTGYENAPYVHTSIPHAAGMLVSTARDLLAWTEALHAGEPFRDPATLERMLTPEREEYAYGIVVRDAELGEGEDGPTVRVHEHGGGIMGFTSHLRHFPEEDRTVVLLDNTGSDLASIRDGISRILFGLPAERPKPSIAERILPVIESAGVEAGLERYRERKRSGEGYRFAADELPNLALHFLEEREDVETAERLMEAAVAEYPDAPYPRWIRSRVRVAAGDTVGAVESLEEGLARAPGTPPLLEALRQLGVEPEPAFRDPTVRLPEETLAGYTGRYRVDPDVILEVRMEGGRLVAQRTGESAFPLIPQGETLFLIRGAPIQLSFQVDASGRATAVTVRDSGRTVTYPRLEE